MPSDFDNNGVNIMSFRLLPCLVPLVGKAGNEIWTCLKAYKGYCRVTLQANYSNRYYFGDVFVNSGVDLTVTVPKNFKFIFEFVLLDFDCK